MYFKELFYATFVVFLAFEPANSAVSQEQMEKLAKAVRNSCLQKIDTTEEKVLAMRKGEFPDDYNLACYTNCIMKTMRTFKNGVLDINMVLKQIDASVPPEMASRLKETVRKCSKEETDSDPCKMCYDYVKCCYRMDPEVFFFP